MHYPHPHTARDDRFENMSYRDCGKSGVNLPAVSLGLWNNFGENDIYSTCKDLVFTAFDCGINHIDIANNYGPPGHEAERTFGRIFNDHLGHYRDELFIATKAGHGPWPSPTMKRGSKKSILSSLDRSLSALGMEYVDLLYQHRPCPDTPVEESMDALLTAVRQGKALYVGISNAKPDDIEKSATCLAEQNSHLLIEQHHYSMLSRHVEHALAAPLEKHGVGCIAFSPLCQGILTDKYLDGIPQDSRAGKGRSLDVDNITKEKLDKARALNVIAKERGQTLAQMALQWTIRLPLISSVLIGASRPEQIIENAKIAQAAPFSDEELSEIEEVLR